MTENNRPPWQRRKQPSMSEWIEVLLLQAPCPDCGLPLGDKANCQFDHDPALADRWDEEFWASIKPNDPRFAKIRHIDCHQAKTSSENSQRAKGKRIINKNLAHQERMRAKIQNFPLPKSSPSEGAKKRRTIPSRPFPKRRS